MTYQVPQHINKDKIFIVKKSEINGRLDPKMALYNQSVQHSLYPLVKLKCLLLSKPQYGANEAGLVREHKEQARYIRITDIDENGLISTDELGATVANLEEKYILNENDIVIARSGATVGKAYIHRHLPYTCVYAGYLIRFVVDSDKILPDYLFAYTQLNPYKEWVNAIQRPSAQPNINAEEYQSLEIPLPNLSKQQEIVDFINEAYTQKRAKEVEAQHLLDSIDDYLLKELGITIPNVDNGLNNRIFFSSFSKIEGNRIDPKYNKQIRCFQELYDSDTWKTLSSVSIVKGQYGANEAAIAYQEGDTRYIRITDIDEIGNLKEHDKKTAQYIDNAYILHNEDILFARSGSVGKCYLHRDVNPSIFAGYLIRFVLNKNVILPEFLFYYCNSSIYWYWVDTIHRPAVQANINAEEYCGMPIPIPSINRQQEIVDYIADIRTRAKALQAEGKAILEDAKRKVEQMIIGE